MNNENRVTDEINFESPRHLNYMFEFRINQCRKFLDHKCTFHKPYNCFDWHFPNQRRRLPSINLDGTFNYNPDLYCNTYNQSTGKCCNGENCQYVHMNAGDTERRYHPRYFKTGICIYETTCEGICGKNGVHCAFAHNQNDLRSPVYDIRESFNVTNNLSALLEKERVLSEDPIWNDIEYVLAFYKTIECKKPPKTCRQGYACPYYHNSKDKRRNLYTFFYQSQSCTYLKPNNDEWQDVTFCPNQDDCTFSHSRTEQQFHYEIFKSSKCNDMIKDNNCPRGPFCAFAHNESELNNGQYTSKMKNGFFKHNLLLDVDKNNGNFSGLCLSVNDSKSQVNQVFQSDQKIPHSTYNKSSLKSFDQTGDCSSQVDSLQSSFSESQSKDISKNLKHILERALSDSSNVSQMSDMEIQRLPELLMKFTAGDELPLDSLPIIREWVDEGDDSPFNFDSVKERNLEIVHEEKAERASTPTSGTTSSDARLAYKNKKLLHKEILETKHKLTKVNHDLSKTRCQLKTIFDQLQKFLMWLEKSEIKDSFKQEIKVEISVIIQNLEKNDYLNDRLSE